MVMNIKSAFLIFMIMAGFKTRGTCQTNTVNNIEQILEVEYLNTGSEMGGYFVFKITKDSIKYYSDGKKTDMTFWKKLTASINLSDFDNSPQAKGASSTDGIDHVLTIKTSKGIHSIILKDSRNDYVHIQGFINILSGKLKEYKIDMF